MTNESFNPWKEAVLDACAEYFYDPEVSLSPSEIVNTLIARANEQALDPLISKPAADLVNTYKQSHLELRRVRAELQQVHLRLGPQGMP